MPLDDKTLKFISQWFQQAAEDLRLAKYGMEANPPFLKGAAFNAQQCAEKALKGFLIFHGQKAPRTHDLRDLLSKASKVQPELYDSLKQVDTLTKYITASRYPTNIDFTKEIVLESINISEQTYDLLYSLIFK